MTHLVISVSSASCPSAAVCKDAGAQLRRPRLLQTELWCRPRRLHGGVCSPSSIKSRSVLMRTLAEGSCLSGQSLPRDCQTDGRRLRPARQVANCWRAEFLHREPALTPPVSLWPRDDRRSLVLQRKTKSSHAGATVLGLSGQVLGTGAIKTASTWCGTGASLGSWVGSPK